MDQELFNRFVKCAVDTLKVDAAQVVPASRFKEDLDADSLDVVELVMALEEEFGLSENIPEEELAEVTTVGQAFDIVVSKL
jgi:acyl carrier protein